MGNIFRFWNQNRRGIISTIVIIVFLIFVIQFFNQIAKKQNRATQNTVELTEDEKKLPTKSIISSQTVSLNATKYNVSLIESFVQKCNNGDVTGAYNMLTDGCKEAIYPTEENFRTGYYNIVFKDKRITDIEFFMARDNRLTYLVRFYEDVLSSGKISNSQKYQEYITIETDSATNSSKLSTNSLIYRKKINQTVEKNGIAVTIVAQDVYKDEERYQVKIQNNTDKDILIDSRQYTKSVYLIGSNNAAYESNIQDISEAMLRIQAKTYKNYKLKFIKIYSANVESERLVFADMVPDYEQYLQTPSVTKDRVSIGVNI